MVIVIKWKEYSKEKKEICQKCQDYYNSVQREIHCEICLESEAQMAYMESYSAKIELELKK